MTKLRILTFFALFFGVAGLSFADTLEMEGIAAGADADRPVRGSTAVSVESLYGAPESKQAAVGDPPISRWEYKNFIVFFEYDRVIHAVVKRQAAS